MLRFVFVTISCWHLVSLAADCYLPVTFTYIVIMPVVEAHFGICHFSVMLPTIYCYLFYCLLFVATDYLLMQFCFFKTHLHFVINMSLNFLLTVYTRVDQQVMRNTW